MNFWLDSLQHNAFDVFQVVWIGVAIYSTHFLTKWYLYNKFEKIQNEVNELKATILEVYDEVCSD